MTKPQAAERLEVWLQVMLDKQQSDGDDVEALRLAIDALLSSPGIAQAIAKLRSEHRAGLTPEIVAAEDALIAAVRAEDASKSLVLPDGILAAAVQRLVDALRGDEGGHVLGSNHAGTCPVCRSLSDLLVLVSAGEHK